MNKTEWNLGDGKMNVCKSVLDKVELATFQLEMRNRTIINIDSYESTILYWAIQDYINKLKSCEKKDNDTAAAGQEEEG